MGLTPEERIRMRNASDSAQQAAAQQDEDRQRVQTDREHANAIPGLVRDVTELAKTVACTMSVRDAGFEHAINVTYTVRTGRLMPPYARKTVASWYLLCLTLANVLTYVTREGELVEFVRQMPYTRRLNVGKLSYTQLLDLKEALGDVEERTFLLDDTMARLKELEDK